MHELIPGTLCSRAAQKYKHKSLNWKRSKHIDMCQIDLILLMRSGQPLGYKDGVKITDPKNYGEYPACTKPKNELSLLFI